MIIFWRTNDDTVCWQNFFISANAGSGMNRSSVFLKIGKLVKLISSIVASAEKCVFMYCNKCLFVEVEDSEPTNATKFFIISPHFLVFIFTSALYIVIDDKSIVIVYQINVSVRYQNVGLTQRLTQLHFAL